MNKKVTEKKNFKKIKENITEVEYKKLMSFTRGNETLRNNTKLNLLRTFTILFFTGMRNHVLEKFLENPYAYIKEHDGTSYIEITADKTEETQVIPIGKTVMNILQKH